MSPPEVKQAAYGETRTANIKKKLMKNELSVEAAAPANAVQQSSNTTPVFPGMESLVKPFKFPASPYEYKVTSLRECPTPEAMQHCETPDKAADYWRMHKRVIRTNYSNPPTHGAQVVALVLTTPALRTLWEGELAAMRVRIKEMRVALQSKLTAAGLQQDMSFITTQQGMFSYSGLNKAQMTRLRDEFGIYGVDSGRICVAALNHSNIDATVAAIARVTA